MSRFALGYLLSLGLAASSLTGPQAHGQTVATGAAPSASTENLLTIGSVAPALDIENWVSQTDGVSEPVTTFKDGQVYVVEFWATWCGPCIASMPHISQLQQEYLDRGVTVVSVSDESLDVVSEFLEREVRGKKNAEGEPLTYAELTANYCLTSDPDGSVNKDYMRAANQNGIPCAFIVGKDGRIDWIGHPMRMDGPLEQVVTDSWDRAAFGEQFRAEQEFEIAMNQALRLLRQGKPDEARAQVAKLAETAPTPELKAQAEQRIIQLEFMVFQQQVAEDQAAAVENLPKLIEMAGGSAGAVNSITWTVAQRADRGEQVSPELLDAAVKQVEQVMDKDNPDPSLTDTLAHLVYHQGDLDRAIKLEEEASAGASGRLKQGIDAYLEMLKEEKASGPADE